MQITTTTRIPMCPVFFGRAKVKLTGRRTRNPVGDLESQARGSG